MRFYVKCDLCNTDFHCEKMKLPKKIMLVEGLDMCDDCRKEYYKRLRKLIKDLQKERFVLPKQNETQPNDKQNQPTHKGEQP